MKQYIIFNDRDNAVKWLKNVLLFTAPALAVFFSQLAAGVDLKTASGLLLLAFWGLLADALRKMENE